MIIYKTNAILIAHGNKKENLQNVQPDILSGESKNNKNAVMIFILFF